MQSPETIAASWSNGAIVFVQTPGSDQVVTRPAAFVYPFDDGLAWIEPSYASPLGTPSPSLHFRDGTPMPTSAGGLAMRTGQGEMVTIEPRFAEDDDDSTTEPLTWFLAYLNENGLQWQAERERVREAISLG